MNKIDTVFKLSAVMLSSPFVLADGSFRVRSIIRKRTKLYVGCEEGNYFLSSYGNQANVIALYGTATSSKLYASVYIIESKLHVTIKL